MSSSAGLQCKLPSSWPQQTCLFLATLVEQSSSSGAYSFSAVQERDYTTFIEPESSLLCSQETATCPILSTMNPVHAFPYSFCKVQLNIILPSMSRSFRLSFLFVFLHQNRECVNPIRATYPALLVYFLFDYPITDRDGAELMKLLTRQFSPYFCYFSS